MRPPETPPETDESTSDRRAPRSSSAKGVNVRYPSVIHAGVQHAHECFPLTYPCVSDFYIVAAQEKLERLAQASGESQRIEQARAAYGPDKQARAFLQIQEIVLEGVRLAKEAVAAAVSHGMIERAYEIYEAQMQHFLQCGDPDWAREGVRLLETQVRPLLPRRRHPLNLRLLIKASDKPS